MTAAAEAAVDSTLSRRVPEFTQSCHVTHHIAVYLPGMIHTAQHKQRAWQKAYRQDLLDICVPLAADNSITSTTSTAGTACGSGIP